MTDTPFEIVIGNCGSAGQTETIVCEHIIRYLPEKRAVYEGRWKDKPVIAKIFEGGFSAKHHCVKEYRILKKLKDMELNFPVPLMVGKTLEKKWVLLTEKISDSENIFELFGNTNNNSDKIGLLSLVCQSLAQQHIKGVFQQDLHLGNFLLQNQKVYGLDPARIKFFSSPLNIKKSISHLAALLSCLSAEQSEDLRFLCSQYASVRNWDFDIYTYGLFKKLFNAHKKKTINRSLKKSLRSSKRTVCIKDKNIYAVFRKPIFDKQSATDFISGIDKLMVSGIVLKDGNTCFISRIEYGGRKLVIKRYNNKGLWHSIRHTLKKSRARKNWLNAQQLLMLGINTPKPTAFIEVRKGFLLNQSYIISEFIDADKLSEIMINPAFDGPCRTKAISHCLKLIKKLRPHRIFHSDLKHSNILVSDDTAFVLDLDGVRFGIRRVAYRKYRRKDIDVFRSYFKRYKR